MFRSRNPSTSYIHGHLLETIRYVRSGFNGAGVCYGYMNHAKYAILSQDVGTFLGRIEDISFGIQDPHHSNQLLDSKSLASIEQKLGLNPSNIQQPPIHFSSSEKEYETRVRLLSNFLNRIGCSEYIDDFLPPAGTTAKSQKGKDRARENKQLMDQAEHIYDRYSAQLDTQLDEKFSKYPDAEKQRLKRKEKGKHLTKFATQFPEIGTLRTMNHFLGNMALSQVRDAQPVLRKPYQQVNPLKHQLLAPVSLDVGIQHLSPAEDIFTVNTLDSLLTRYKERLIKLTKLAHQNKQQCGLLPLILECYGGKHADLLAYAPHADQWVLFDANRHPYFMGKQIEVVRLLIRALISIPKFYIGDKRTDTKICIAYNKSQKQWILLEGQTNDHRFAVLLQQLNHHIRVHIDDVRVSITLIPAYNKRYAKDFHPVFLDWGIPKVDDPNQCDDIYLEPALFHACKLGDIERVKALIRAGASIRAVSPTTHDSFPGLVITRHQTEIMKFLILEAKLDVNLEDSAAHTLLDIAVTRGDPAIVSLLLSQGARTTSSRFPDCLLPAVSPDIPLKETYLYYLACREKSQNVIPVLKEFQAQQIIKAMTDYVKNEIQIDPLRRQLFEGLHLPIPDNKIDNEILRIRLDALRQVNFMIRRHTEELVKLEDRYPDSVKYVRQQFFTLFKFLYQNALEVTNGAAYNSLMDKLMKMDSQARNLRVKFNLYTSWFSSLFCCGNQRVQPLKTAHSSTKAHTI